MVMMGVYGQNFSIQMVFRFFLYPTISRSALMLIGFNLSNIPSMHVVLYILHAILNLPRSERYSADNIILLGVIPGPKEPELTINTFLEPLVDELLQLWNGVVMRTHNSSVLVRSALLCVACDIPAARKVCGLVAHNSLLACSRCSKIFPTECFGEKADYSGFNRDVWPPRSLAVHKTRAIKYQVLKIKQKESQSNVNMDVDIVCF